MTKPINEMTLEELAEYAVTLEGWEWMPGMVDGYGDVIVSCASGDWIYICGRMDDESTKREVAIGTSLTDVYPDLTDPATLGCVLAMVRKRISQWFYVEPVRGGGGYVGKVPFLGAPPVTGDMKTEAHALIAALEKEVRP